MVHQKIQIAVVVCITLAMAGGAVADDPAPSPQDHARQLVRQLGDADYYVRQQAQDELARLGFEAFDALSEATDDADLEIASRAKYLLRLMRVQWTVEGDPPEVKQCLRDYEFDALPAREAKMRALAALPNGQGAEALCRLVRFEKLPLLSKVAAVTLLSGRVGVEPPGQTAIAAVRNALGDSKRPGALWLLGWTRLGDDPEAVLTEWSRWIDDEKKLLQSSSNETTPEIVAALSRFQIAQWKRLGKTDEAMAGIRELLDLQRLQSGDLESLAELLDWLIGQKAWKAIDDLSQRFAGQFANEPGLLYMLAQAHAEQGQREQAEETAARALQLFPGKQQRQLVRHLMVAQNLRSRGQFPWARREFEHVIDQADGQQGDDLRVMAQTYLAEMLHDQGQDLDAAAVLKKLVEQIDAGGVAESALAVRRPSEVRSRMHYFTACHWENQGDAAQHRQALDQALEADPLDIDVLIACYRLPDQTPEYHAKILDWIQKSADDAQQQITEEPDNPSPYNQYAWLIGNTEGDFDEALRCSRKSLELLEQMPELKINEAGFYDTLAHVHFARGELEDAVRQQTKAAELDPHSGLIRRQLEFFSKKLEEKRGEKP